MHLPYGKMLLTLRNRATLLVSSLSSTLIMFDLLISRNNVLDLRILQLPYYFLSKPTGFEVETVFSDEELSNAW